MASTSSPSSFGIRRGGGDRGLLCDARGCGAAAALKKPWRRSFPCCSAAANGASGLEPLAIPETKRTTSADRLPAEKLDEWVHESVTEIVRNIAQAPFLVHVFSNADKNRGSSSSSSILPSSSTIYSSSAGLRLKREAARAESWQGIRERWAAAPPDGVILVEELAEEDAAAAATAGDDSSSKTWGLLVQGRGADCAACYILRTCRVRSSAGFCTHFCLAKAKCFGDSAASQLRGSWLLPL